MPWGGRRPGAGRPKGRRNTISSTAAPIADVPPPVFDAAARLTPTPEQRGQVEAMAGYGVPARAIALVLRISTDELRAHFHAELDRGLAVGTVAVAQNLYKLATGAIAPRWRPPPRG